MAIPKRLKVGGITYKVKKVRQIDRSAENVGGLQSETSQEIHLKKGMGRELTEKVFVHELIHAVFCHCDMEHDENKVELLANALYMVAKDNPGVFDFD